MITNVLATYQSKACSCGDGGVSVEDVVRTDDHGHNPVEQYIVRAQTGSSLAVVHLSVEDARALRDFLVKQVP